MAPKIVKVANAAQLKTALTSYKGDTTIVLKDGDYGSVTIRNTAKVGDLKLVAAAGSDPTMTLRIVNAHDVTLEGITFEPTTTKWGSGATVTNSKNVSFVDNDFVGTDSSFTDLSRGLSVTNSKKVLVADNDFSGLMRGAVFTRSDDLKVLGNDFRDMRSEGMNFAGVQRVEIGHNTATDFRPSRGDHPDFIQFWTNGMSRASTDIHIHDNVGLRGDGGGSQGIFIDNDNHVPYRNIVIENNTIQTDYPNGIAVVEAEGLVIRDNVALSTPGAQYKTQIRVLGSSDVEFVGNQANAMSLVDSDTIKQSGNTIVDRLTGSTIDHEDDGPAAATLSSLDGMVNAHGAQAADASSDGNDALDAADDDGSSGLAGDGLLPGGADRFVFGPTEASGNGRAMDFSQGTHKIAYQALKPADGSDSGLDGGWFTASSGNAPDADQGASPAPEQAGKDAMPHAILWEDEAAGGTAVTVAAFNVAPKLGTDTLIG